MTRSASVLAVVVIVVSALLGARVSPAAAVAIKQCGAVAGPQVQIGKTKFSHYGVVGLNADCGFAKQTVSAVVKQRLPNSSTPVRAKAPTGWICIAQEVVSHVAIAGHCQRGRSSAFSWVGVGLHL